MVWRQPETCQTFTYVSVKYGLKMTKKILSLGFNCPEDRILQNLCVIICKFTIMLRGPVVVIGKAFNYYSYAPAPPSKHNLQITRKYSLLTVISERQQTTEKTCFKTLYFVFSSLLFLVKLWWISSHNIPIISICPTRSTLEGSISLLVPGGYHLCAISMLSSPFFLSAHNEKHFLKEWLWCQKKYKSVQKNTLNYKISITGNLVWKQI